MLQFGASLTDDASNVIHDHMFTTQATGAVFTMLHFLYNLRKGTISWTVSLHWAENDCKGQTL
jgi:hypothetical protein